MIVHMAVGGLADVSMVALTVYVCGVLSVALFAVVMFIKGAFWADRKTVKSHLEGMLLGLVLGCIAAILLLSSIFASMLRQAGIVISPHYILGDVAVFVLIGLAGVLLILAIVLGVLDNKAAKARVEERRREAEGLRRENESLKNQPQALPASAPPSA